MAHLPFFGEDIQYNRLPSGDRYWNAGIFPVLAGQGYLGFEKLAFKIGHRGINLMVIIFEIITESGS
jgi:hypothetical protein